MTTQMIAVAAAFAVVGDICGNLVSASQIDKFDDTKDGGCQRRWAWRYIARIPDDAPGEAAELGTECDNTQLQPYLRDDRPIDYSRRSGYIVQPGLAYLPKPRSPGIEVQRHFVMPGGQRPVHSGVNRRVVGHTAPLFGYQGYVDLWVPDASVMPDVAYDPKQGPRVLEDGFAPPVVDDFKTTGNWKYLKTPKILETDTQAQLYAKWAMVHTGAGVVDLIWTYFATKGAYRAKRSHLRVTRDHVDAQMKRIDDLATQMHRHRKAKTNPLELLPNVDACEAFHRPCPYSSRCNLSPTQKIEAKAAQHARQQKEIPIMSDASSPSSPLGTLARLKAQKAALTGGATGGAALQPTANGMGCAPENVPAPTEIPARLLGINPPEKDLPPAPPIGSVQAPPVPKITQPDLGGQAAADRGVAAVTPPTSANADTSAKEALADTAVDKPAKRGPGRPRKSETKDPLGADIAMHTAMAKAGEALVQSLEKKPATVETLQETIESVPITFDALLESVSVTWAEETLCPVAYNPFKVGPFEATGFVRKGESISQASARIYAELVTFAENARAEKAISFAATLKQIGGGK